AGSVDRICHVAALVNHRLSYSNLFGPNVLGSAEVIRLALSEKRKAIDFISTVGVFMLLEKGGGIHEGSAYKAEIQLSEKYAAGYAISKWAGENLFRKAHKEYDLPVNVFRCDMILPDQRYKGQLNSSDMLTRLLYSILTTRLAPESFYRREGNSKSYAHYPGLPVDTLSKAIAGAYRFEDQAYKVYHAINYVKDDISLDSFVDWIETAGYEINRIEEHPSWYERMQTKLKSLPEAERQLSALDILMAYARPMKSGYSNIGTANFQELVAALDELGPLSSLSEAYIHKYLKDMELRGLFSKQK
ncbi:MAG: SDR family oxidoreductase, partial [Bacteroidota bacterium]